VRHLKILILTALTVAAASAQAFVYSNLTSADVNLHGQSGTGILTVSPANSIGPANTNGLIDFFPNNVVAIGGTAQNSVNYAFSYDVSNTTPIDQIGLVLLGQIKGHGQVHFTEQVFQLVGGIVTGPALVNYSANFVATTVEPQLNVTGGNYTFSDNTGLFLGVTGGLSPQTNYRVIKTISVFSGDGGVTSNDFATVSLVEQNHQPVPEPATFAVFGVGALALLRRKNRR